MRTSTKTAVGLASLGLFVGSYQAGLAAETGFNFASASTPAASAEPSASASSPSGTTDTPAANSPAASATPSPTATKAPAIQKVSKQSGVINYEYGVVQVTITKSGGTITAVNLDQGTATDGRQAAFPSLIQATINANGTGFGNISQATMTTNAYKQAVNSALAKF